MKIGILTLPLVDNYGGILQAVALCKFLEKRGHDVVLIYKDRDSSSYIKPWKKVLKAILLKVPFHDYKSMKTIELKRNKRQQLRNVYRPFIEEQIRSISEDLFTKDDLQTFAEKECFDAVIVGSDQVWRKLYMSDSHYKCYFLDFVSSSSGVRKISYAASFGKDKWEGVGDELEISELLSDFTAVSTREYSGIDVCQKTFGIEGVQHVLDPTLIVGKEFYLEKLIPNYDVSNIQKGGLLTYVLDEATEKRKIIEHVQSYLKIKKTQHLKGFKQENQAYTVPQWVASFAFAEFVITDSFHGMLFSLLFEKNFVVIGNHDRGLDRFISLLSLIGLENRLISSQDELKKLTLAKPDYESINQVLNANKIQSIEFLETALK